MQMKGISIETKMHLDDQAHRELIGVPEVTEPPPFYKANLLEQSGKHKEAEDIYQTMLSEDFDNNVVMAALGMNYAVQGKHGMAHVLLTRALSDFESFEKNLGKVGIIQKGTEAQRIHFLKTKRSEMMNAIGTCFKHENRCDKARYWFEKAQAVLPELNADIQNNLATLHINEGSPEKAMRILDKALEIDPNHPQAHWNRALARLETGDYAGGFDEYHWGKRAEVRMNRNYSNTDIPEWDGSPGKRLVIYGEQGIGDEIMFASLLPGLIHDCSLVVYDCHKKLHRLMASSFPMIDIYPTREDENISWPMMQGPDGKPVSKYNFDARIAMGDIPKFYRRHIDDFPGFPYIKPTAKAQAKWAAKLNDMFPDGKPIIAINWIGGHKKTRVEVRSMQLEQWLPILSLDAHFVSLQYTECQNELKEFEAKHGIKIHHLGEAAHSEHYDDVGGVLANVELVVTCCSSIVHLAGAMGVPCWVLTPSRPAWRYGIGGGPAGDRMPWYGDTVVLFRQDRGSVAWEPVITEVADSLKELIEARNEGSENTDSGTGTEDSSPVVAGSNTGSSGETV
jgi:tetratricopeptide (TPR) repeat protein